MAKGRGAALERLRHMIDAADAITAYAARGHKAFDTDPAIRDAILYQVVILGEAVKAALAADPSLESELPDVEWAPMARMRDRVTHRSWTTDREIVWSTATVAVPELRRALTAALSRLQQQHVSADRSRAPPRAASGGGAAGAATTAPLAAATPRWAADRRQLRSANADDALLGDGLHRHPGDPQHQPGQGGDGQHEHDGE